MKGNHKAKITQRKDSKETETEYELAELRKGGKQSTDGNTMCARKHSKEQRRHRRKAFKMKWKTLKTQSSNTLERK